MRSKTRLWGRGSKVPHLTYLGDTSIGSGVNIGLGTVTCNYDGKKKHPTVIDDGAFVGNNCNFSSACRNRSRRLHVAQDLPSSHQILPPGAQGVARSRAQSPRSGFSWKQQDKCSGRGIMIRFSNNSGRKALSLQKC